MQRSAHWRWTFCHLAFRRTAPSLTNTLWRNKIKWTTNNQEAFKQIIAGIALDCSLPYSNHSNPSHILLDALDVQMSELIIESLISPKFETDGKITGRSTRLLFFIRFCCSVNLRTGKSEYAVRCLVMATRHQQQQGLSANCGRKEAAGTFGLMNDSTTDEPNWFLESEIFQPIIYLYVAGIDAPVLGMCCWFDEINNNCFNLITEN